MNELEKLIKKHCPDGVEYKPLGEVCEIKRGIRVTRNSLEERGKIPVYQNSLTPLGYYYKNNCIANTTFVIAAGAAGEIGFCSCDFWAADDCYYFSHNNTIDHRYLYHLLLNNQNYILSRVRRSSIPRLPREALEQLQIPHPPIEVQRKIVDILDKYSVNVIALQQELEAELTLRKKQYEHYRDTLLSFDEKMNGGGYGNKVEWKTLGEICLKTNNIKWKEQTSEFDYIDLTSVNRNNGNITIEKKINKENAPSRAQQIINTDDVLYATTRPTLQRYCIITERYNNQICSTGFSVLRPDKDKILPLYLYFIVGSKSFLDYVANNQEGTSYPSISDSKLRQFSFSLPPIETQKRIVSILDKFEMLANSLSQGLPAEIEARKKQYEYYRDLLLDFKDTSNGGGYYLLEKIAQWLPLGEIATEMYRGAGIKRDEVTVEGMPCVRYGEIYTTYDIWFDECVSHTDEESIASKKYFEYGDILFAITGESVEEIAKSCAYVGKEKCLAGGDIVVMKHRQNPKYLAYALSTTDAQQQKSKGKIKSKVVHASVPSISSIVIPLPPIEIQNWIVEILDKFHSLVTDIEQGIPAEIEARKKQYEYYRDKLLSFEDVRSFRQAQ